MAIMGYSLEFLKCHSVGEAERENVTRGRRNRSRRKLKWEDE